MLLSSFGPRGSSLAVLGFVAFAIGCLYILDIPPIHRVRIHSSQAPQPEPSPRYKPPPPTYPPVVENFPAAVHAKSPADLPPVPSFNRPNLSSDAEPAPLLIGFTRNWPILQQAVVSYIAAGWPADQIYVIENTGTMDSNKRNRLTLQNPFYIDYARLTKIFGVNVVTTPTLLTFAQLQNFMMFLAIEKEWASYFWSHMDVAILNDEGYTVADKDDSSTGKYANLFARVITQRDELNAWQRAGDHQNGPEEHRNTNGKWALHFFAYDRLTLVNLESFKEVGGWDPMIPYYMGDCDFYERLHMGNYRMGSSDIGLVADVGTSLPDLGVYYRRNGWPKEEEDPAGPQGPSRDFGEEDSRGGAGYDSLHEKVQGLYDWKLKDGEMERNFWQKQQQGGQGEPFYVDSAGFEIGLWMTIENGRKVYAEKWGHQACDIQNQHLMPGDAWRVEHDW